MKLLVTGSAEFIGYHHTVKKLLKDGFDMVGLDNINYHYSPQLKYARLKEAGIYLEELKNFQPEIYETSLKTWEARSKAFLPETGTTLILSVSIEYAVMKRSEKIKS